MHLLWKGCELLSPPMTWTIFLSEVIFLFLSLSLRLPKINREWKMDGLWLQMTKDRDLNTGGTVGLGTNTTLVPLSLAQFPLWCICQPQVQVFSPYPSMVGPSRCWLFRYNQYLAPHSQCFLRFWELCSCGPGSQTSASWRSKSFPPHPRLWRGSTCTTELGDVF